MSRPARSLSPWLVVVVALALVACRRAPPPPVAPRLETPIPVPAPGPRLPCADVGASRVCWSGALEASAVERPVPATPASSPLGWRCAWPGRARLCVDRRAGAGAFVCAGERCTQAHARRPDDGEWTCVDSAGAEVCLSEARAAGVAPAPADPAWICGARRGARRRGAELEVRVCVDLSPDVPDGALGGWRCRAGNGAAPTRVCERGARAGDLGTRCSAREPCVDGGLCLAGRCVPARPAPSCWLDDDCPGGACRFGTCRNEAAP